MHLVCKKRGVYEIQQGKKNLNNEATTRIVPLCRSLQRNINQVEGRVSLLD